MNPSNETQAHLEAFEALGWRLYERDKRLRRVYVSWLLRRKKFACEQREARRLRREERHRAIAAGEIAPLSIFEVGSRAYLEDPDGHVSLREEFREDARRQAERRDPVRAVA